MTKYNFDLLREGETAFYYVRKEGEGVFRNAVASWVKRRRESGKIVVIRCNRITKIDIMRNTVFLGMEITREE